MSKPLATLSSGPAASITIYLIKSIFSLIFVPLHLRKPPPIPSTQTPPPHTSSTTLQFIRWSPKHGRNIIGTPFATLSSTEFTPQCITNTPTAPCLCAPTCGVLSTIFPRSLVLATKSSGNTFTLSSLNDQKHTPLSSNASVSATSSSFNFSNVPNPLYTTDFGFYRSNQGIQSIGSFLARWAIKNPTSSKFGNFGF